MADHDKASLRKRLDQLAGTPAGRALTDSEKHWQQIVDALAADEDPTLREIGGQLRDGTIRPRDLFTIPGYDTVMDGQLDSIRKLDPTQVYTALVDRLDATLQETDGSWS